MPADVAETVWYNEDSAQPLTVNKPAGFAAGQILILVIVQHAGGSTQSDLTAPGGWTEQGQLDGTTIDGKVWSHPFNAGDPSSWNFGYRTTADVAAGLFRITGADTTPVIVVGSAPTATVTSSIDSPSVNPSGSDDLLICCLADQCNGTVLAETDPSSMTDLGQTQVVGNFMALAAVKQQLASGAATGVRTWTSVSPTGIPGGTLSIAVKSGSSAVAIPDGSGGSATGGTADAAPVVFLDGSGGAITGGTVDAVQAAVVLHDNMVMPIVTAAHACLVTEVGKLANPPLYVQMRPGAAFIAMADQVTDECCQGIAWVRPGQQTPAGSHWPDPLSDVDGTSGGQPSFYAIQLELGIERCMPTVSNVEGQQGQMPTAAQWQQATLDHLDDAAALRRTVCCLQAIYGKKNVLVANPIAPLQNEANCGGQTVLVVVRAAACDCVG